MYSRKSWGGSIEPFVLVKFLPDHTEDESDPIASLIIFEWQDEPLIGRIPTGGDSYRDLETICTTDSVAGGLCEEKDIGAFILAPNATDSSKNPIYNEAIHLKDPKAINYPIRKTGYYCVSTYAFSDHEYNGVVEFRNAYGELPAAQIAKLPFYGGLTIVYAVLGAFWAFLYFQNRSDILPVQNYITAIIIFLIVEQLMTWGFYDYQNRHGNNALNKAFMIVVSIFNAGRNSFSFFLLLIVCMGYGVVKPSLGRAMIYVRILAAAHFIFGVIYAITSMAVTPESVGPLILFVILPLAGTMTAFYVWTLSSLNVTIKDLIDRKQKTKAMMYKKLSWCILGSVMVIFAFFFINSFALAGSSSVNFVPDHWQTRWFVLDGWLNIVYFFNIAFIAYLWRPTANNRRFAMSDEVSLSLFLLLCRLVYLRQHGLTRFVTACSRRRWFRDSFYRRLLRRRGRGRGSRPKRSRTRSATHWRCRNLNDGLTCPTTHPSEEAVTPTCTTEQQPSACAHQSSASIEDVARWGNDLCGRRRGRRME